MGKVGYQDIEGAIRPRLDFSVDGSDLVFLEQGCFGLDTHPVSEFDENSRHFMRIVF